MTLEELKIKLTAAEDKVTKRMSSLSKVCKKLSLNSDSLLEHYKSTKEQLKQDYLPHKISSEIVAKFISKRERLDNMTSEEYWEMCDYNDKISQVEDNLCKLFDAEKVVAGWRVKYDTQKNKEDAPKIKVLWDFLTNWEEQALNWYKENAKHYFELTRDFDKNTEEYIKSDRLAKQVEFEAKFYSNSPVEVIKDKLVREWKRNYYSYVDNLTKEVTTINKKYVYSNFWTISETIIESYTVDEKRLSDVIAQEKLNKYYDLCNRISAVVGEITDVNNLSIGNQHGELNGVIIGTKGKANIDTISAGGYNIQCFHYRVLVHKLNK